MPVLPRLANTTAGTGEFDVASDGTLVYWRRRKPCNARTLVWVDRTGKEEPIARRRAPTSTRASHPTGHASPSGAAIRRTTSGSRTWRGRRSRA